MKKFFFFRPSTSNNGNNKDLPPSSTQEEVYWENPPGSKCNSQSKGLFSKSRKQVSGDSQSSNNDGPGPALRRSRSLSSAAFLGVDSRQDDFSPPETHCRSPASTRSGVSHKPFDHSFCSNATERTKLFDAQFSQVSNAPMRPTSHCSARTHQDSSGSSSSTCSSGKVVDRYIDGEQQQQNGKSNHGNFAGNGGYRRPPRVQYTSPSYQVDSLDEKALSHSSKEAKSSRLRFSSRDWAETGYGNESPRSVAKNVVERLSQSRPHQKFSKKELDHELPVTLEDIYSSGSMNRCFDSNPDAVGDRSYSLEETFETIDNYDEDDYHYSQKAFTADYSANVSSKETEDEVDVDLKRRSKEAEERVVLLSEELEQESFFRDCGFDVPSLIQTIRNLAEERVSLALQVSSSLHSQIAGRATSKEEGRLARAELESQTRRLEKEKNELQFALERELDRRSCEWSSKLEKYQSEEHKLRERIRELAQQNVSLQREVSSFNVRDSESRKKETHFDQQLNGLSRRVEDMTGENQDLKERLSEVQESYKALDDERVCLWNSIESKESECKELHKSITKLVRACSEQDKTISGLREVLGETMGKNEGPEHVLKFQMEQMRLTGVEQALRREIETFRAEVGSLRHENISLLNRMKGNGKERQALTAKLDNELWSRVCFLQNQGLSMLNDTAQLCSKLLMFIKGKCGQFSEALQDSEAHKNTSGLDGHFMVDSEMKLQGLRRGIENLTRSLQKMSSLLNDKSNLSDGTDLIPSKPQTSEGVMRYELKAETLLTSLLREKLCSKEQEVEQLREEVATAVRGADIFQCEVQNAMDTISSLSHKLRDLEIQMLKKDESHSRVVSDLRGSNKELAVMKGILPNVTEERDVMFDEVKKCREKNMLLNSEVNELKRKMEALEEDILVKEGQIQILKDSCENKRFDLLATPDSFRL